MPPKSPVKEDEGKKTVNLAHYALVLANKKIEMLGTSEDQTDLERLAKSNFSFKKSVE